MLSFFARDVLNEIWDLIKSVSGGGCFLPTLPGPGRPTIWMTAGQGPTALAVGAGGGCFDIITLLYLFLLRRPLSGRRPDNDKYCLKGPINLKQPLNQFPQTGGHSATLIENSNNI